MRFNAFEKPGKPSFTWGLFFYIMPKIIKFHDELNELHEVEIFINSDNRLFLKAGILRSEEDESNTGWITLSKEDAILLTQELAQLIRKLD